MGRSDKGLGGALLRAAACAVTALLIAGSVSCAKPSFPEPGEEFGGFSDYWDWSYAEGYPAGELIDDDNDGINRDRFFTRPGTEAYDSGRIVVGDSRCVQLGIYQQRAGGGDFAVFALWGGHYDEADPYLPTEAFYEEVEACFRRQIEVRGRCEIFFFATVNDYDPSGEWNSRSVGAAVACARRLASMRYELSGRGGYAPSVTVIGVEGSADAEFSLRIDEFNALLYEALDAEPALASARRTTVSEIVLGRAGFIDDGLHYDDATLKKLVGFIVSSKGN